MSDTSKLPDLLVDLCIAAGPTQSIDPDEAARAFATHGNRTTAWPHYLQNVRDAAVALAREGRLIIYQQGKPVDPDSFRGLYRLGCPNFG